MNNIRLLASKIEFHHLIPASVVAGGSIGAYTGFKKGGEEHVALGVVAGMALGPGLVILTPFAIPAVTIGYIANKLSK